MVHALVNVEFFFFFSNKLDLDFFFFFGSIPPYFVGRFEW